MKIKLYGITGRILNIIRSFLNSRPIQVVIDRYIYIQPVISAGVLQVAILGQLVLLIFINDLSDDIVSEMGIFADDKTLYSMHKGRTGV